MSNPIEFVPMKVDKVTRQHYKLLAARLGIPIFVVANRLVVAELKKLDASEKTKKKK